MTENDFDPEAFLEWLEEDVDGYYVKVKRVEEEWPGFQEATGGLVGVTMILGDDDETLVPVRDYRQKILYGVAWD